jgi:hypothetical protein
MSKPEHIAAPPELSVVARFLSALHECYTSPAEIGRDLDAVLAFLHEQSAAGKGICSTDLVRERRFGTLPTVTSDLRRLSELGLIEQVVAEDRRIKWLKTTAAADKLFEQRAKLLTEAGFKVG